MILSGGRNGGGEEAEQGHHGETSLRLEIKLLLFSVPMKISFKNLKPVRSKNLDILYGFRNQFGTMSEPTYRISFQNEDYVKDNRLNACFHLMF